VTTAPVYRASMPARTVERPVAPAWSTASRAFAAGGRNFQRIRGEGATRRSHALAARLLA
jgi:hypothetical protein